MSASKKRKRSLLLKRREVQADRAMRSMLEMMDRVEANNDLNGDVFISTINTNPSEPDCDCPLCSAMQGGLGEAVESSGGAAVHRMSEHDMMIYRQICEDMAAGKYGEKYQNVNRVRVTEL